MTMNNGQLFLPQLVEEEKGPWTIYECEIRESSVNLRGRVARVPRARTRAQRLARFHELGHVKYTPRDYFASIQVALRLAEARGERIDPTTVLKITKMLEENRIDWLLWDRHGIDIRSSREVLDWATMPAPTEPLSALKWVLQLAWTVWASRGLPNRIPNPPPPRIPDPATAAFFDQVWAVCFEHHPDLCVALTRGCLAIYADPTHDTRDRVASELATFFPPPPEQEELPPPTPEQQQEEAEAEEREREMEQSREQEQDAGVGSTTTDLVHYQIHDHTTGIRRPSMRIARKEVPQFTGTKLTFPHRYMLDRAIFARRILTEGGIMVDASGSMKWNNDDLIRMLEKLPAVTIGIYGGTHTPGLVGRICVLAKKGRFSKYNPAESDFNGYNDVDLEALWLLATWPRPRFWLSDGLACGGRQSGPHPDPALRTTHHMQTDGLLIEKINRFMKQHEILRVANEEDMHKLVARKRVTLYRSAVNRTRLRSNIRDGNFYWPPSMLEQPVSYQL